MPKPLCIFLTLLLAALCGHAAAQQAAYVSDEVFIVLHAGPGTNYRWVAKLTPGTGLEVTGTSEDAEWSEVNTDRGTSGWVRSEFVTSQKPAQVLLPTMEQRVVRLEELNRKLTQTLKETEGGRAQIEQDAADTQSQLTRITEELAQLKQVSGRAIQLDTDNKRLVESLETLRSEVDMLQADNQRLGEKLRSSAFLDGALAVLLGVFITLVVPRLWPKRRSSSSWV